MRHPSQIRLLIADDHAAVRIGLNAMLGGTEIVVVAEAATGQEAVKYALEKDVDVVLMDIRMPGGDGLSALVRIRSDKPDLPILIFSSFDDPMYIARAVAMGANGYLQKLCTREELIAAIKKAAAGGSLWTGDELHQVTRALTPSRLGVAGEVPLTEGEVSVLQQLACGLTNRQIADVLHISYSVVKEHVHHVLKKLGVANRTNAAIWAVRRGLASGPGGNGPPD